MGEWEDMPANVYPDAQDMEDDAVMSYIVDALQVLGVDTLDANRYVSKVVRPKEHITVVEACGTSNLIRLSPSRMRNPKH